MSAVIAVPENPNRENQETSNRRVTVLLSEEAERAISIAETFLSFTHTRLPALEERNPHLQAALHEYDSLYKWAAPSGWNEQALMQRCEQKTPSTKIAEYLDRPKPNVYEAANILRDFSGEEPLPRGKYLLRKDEINMMDLHQCQVPAQTLSHVTMGLYDTLHADVLAELRAELSASEVTRAKLQRNIEKYRTERDQAVALSDMLAVEKAHKQLIDAHYEMCELCAQRVDHVNAGGEDDLEFKRQMEEVRRDAEATYNFFYTEKNAALQLAVEDLQATDQVRDEEEAKHRLQLQQFVQFQQDSSTALQQNLSVQHALVEEIKAKIIQLHQNCEQRRDLIGMFMEAKQREEQRIAAFDEFTDLLDQHVARTKQVKDYLSRCSTIADSLNEFKTEMFRRLDGKDLAAIVAQLAVEESERFLKEYRDFVYCCGDLSTKKMHRFDTLERQVRLTKHHRDTALDSLDPKIHKYNEELDQLVVHMRDCEGILTLLQANQDSAEQLFTPAENILRIHSEKTGVSFTHPLQEFGTKAVEERRSFVERALRFVEDEERQVAKKRDDITKMKQIAMQEQQTLNQDIKAQLQGRNVLP